MIKFDNVRVGRKYRVIKNRNSTYGSCSDIIDLEGQQVTVIDIDKEHKDLYVKSNIGEHCVRCDNIEDNEINKLEDKLFDTHMNTMFNLVDVLCEREELTEAEQEFLDAFFEWNEFLDSQEEE